MAIFQLVLSVVLLLAAFEQNLNALSLSGMLTSVLGWGVLQAADQAMALSFTSRSQRDAVASLRFGHKDTWSHQVWQKVEGVVEVTRGDAVQDTVQSDSSNAYSSGTEDEGGRRKTVGGGSAKDGHLAGQLWNIPEEAGAEIGRTQVNRFARLTGKESPLNLCVVFVFSGLMIAASMYLVLE